MKWYVYAFPWAAVQAGAQPRWLYMGCEPTLEAALAYARKWRVGKSRRLGRLFQYYPPDMHISISSRSDFYWEIERREQELKTLKRSGFSVVYSG